VTLVVLEILVELEEQEALVKLELLEEQVPQVNEISNVYFT